MLLMIATLLQVSNYNWNNPYHTTNIKKCLAILVSLRVRTNQINKKDWSNSSRLEYDNTFSIKFSDLCLIIHISTTIENQSNTLWLYFYSISCCDLPLALNCIECISDENNEISFHWSSDIFWCKWKINLLLVCHPYETSKIWNVSKRELIYCLIYSEMTWIW